MFDTIRISPSILSADFLNLESEIEAIGDAGADWVHVDVMDGHFVPNLTIGLPVLSQLRQATKLPLDVHLMVSNPLEQLPWFLQYSPDFATIHWEALGEGEEDEQAKQAIDLIHEAGAKAGISVKPDTPVQVLESTIQHWDMVLVMSVYPGFSGQKFIDETPERVRMLANLCEERGASPLIQVDGGIDEATAPRVSSFGADVLVAGNAVFKQESYGRAISSIRNAALQAQVRR